MRTPVDTSRLSARRLAHLLHAHEESRQWVEDPLLPDDFVRRLGQLDGAGYRQGLDTAALDRWWTTDDRHSLRRALGNLGDAVEEATRPRSLGARVGHGLVEVISPIGASALVGYVSAAAAHVPPALVAAIGAGVNVLGQGVSRWASDHLTTVQLVQYASEGWRLPEEAG